MAYMQPTMTNLAIIFIFTVLFGTAALDKLKSFSVPDWFIKQFANTVIAKLPGGAKAGYWMIAGCELSLTCLFLGSAIAPQVLPLALTGSMFLFGMLCFGLRLAADFQGSANMFIYFTTALISLQIVSQQNSFHF